MAICLTLVATIVSFRFYVETMNVHSKGVTMRVAQTIAAVMPADEIQSYRDDMLEIYHKSPEPEITDSYLAQFDHITDETYYETLDLLNTLRDTNNLLYLYVCYMDPETMTGIYLIDADPNDDGCPIGTWDIIYENNYEAMKHPENGFEAYITHTEDYGWLSSAGAAILSDSGEVVGHVFVDNSMQSVVNDRIDFLVQTLFSLAISTVICLIVFLYHTNKSVVVPIGVITDETRQFIDTKSAPTQALTDINTQDELQELAGSVHKMQEDILSYISNLTSITAEKERVATELEVARSIQEGILPCLFPAFPSHIELDVYATLNPAKEMSGDFYDFFLVDDDHMAMVMADVSGKGVPAALFMMVSRSLIKTTTQTGISPKEVLEKVNNQLCENNEGELFVTTWLGVYQISTGEMVCSNAGHEYPVIRRVGGEYELFKDPHGFVLGGMEDMKYSEYTIKMEVGDRIFLYTDGIPEATNAEEELFGNHRMLESLNRYRYHSTQEQLEGMLQDVENFVGAAPQFDDITMIAFQREQAD